MLQPDLITVRLKAVTTYVTAQSDSAPDGMARALALRIRM
jgi:hypothetical protein